MFGQQPLSNTNCLECSNGWPGFDGEAEWSYWMNGEWLDATNCWRSLQVYLSVLFGRIVVDRFQCYRCTVHFHWIFLLTILLTKTFDPKVAHYELDLLNDLSEKKTIAAILVGAPSNDCHLSAINSIQPGLHLQRSGWNGTAAVYAISTAKLAPLGSSPIALRHGHTTGSHCTGRHQQALATPSCRCSCSSNYTGPTAPVLFSSLTSRYPCAPGCQKFSKISENFLNTLESLPY